MRTGYRYGGCCGATKSLLARLLACQSGLAPALFIAVWANRVTAPFVTWTTTSDLLAVTWWP